jgi:Holliday junction resolvase RusA-like endonuclease
VYYGKRYSQWRKDAWTTVEAATGPTISVAVRAEVVFAVERSRTGTLETPVGDGDNYEKAIYDLLQAKGYLADDRQITTATWRKRFVPHGTQGYTEVSLWEETEEIELPTSK